MVGSAFRTTKPDRPPPEVSVTSTRITAFGLVEVAKTGREMPERGPISTSRSATAGPSRFHLMNEALPPAGWLAMCSRNVRWVSLRFWTRTTKALTEACVPSKGFSGFAVWGEDTRSPSVMRPL